MGATIEDMPMIRFPEPFNCVELFADRQVNMGNAEHAAIITTEETVTYGRLAQQSARYGQALLDLGVKPGERIALVLPDSPEFIYLFMGAIRAGIVPVPLSTALGTVDYAYILDDCKCSGVIHAAEFGAIAEAAQRAAARPGFCLPLQPVSDQATKVSAWGGCHRSRAEDDCFILYSSGTTGRPKGVVHAHSCLPVIASIFSEHMIGRSDSDVFLSMPRMYTSFGMGIGIAIPLWLGATVVADPRRPRPEEMAALIGRFKPTIFAAVPTFYSQLISCGHLHREDAASLRFCLSGGEAMPAELLRRWIALTDVPVREMIGSTEAGFVYIGNRLDDIRPGTSGKPLPGFQLRIVDADGNPCSDEAPGHLLVRGQSVMSRYWNNPEKTAQALVDGWLDTGDVYFRDRDGYYTYCGRGDDMLKVGGRWISPFEIESALVEHPQVLEAAVVGRSDEDGLVKAQAWVVLKDPRQMPESISEELRAFCKERLAPYKCPKWVNAIEQLPKTAAGKVQRFKLRNNPPGCMG